MTAHRIDTELPRAPIVGAAVTGDVHGRVLELATEMGSTSAAVRELLSLGIAVLDGGVAERAPRDGG